MHYLRNGRTIPGFESEDVISADAPIDVDIEQLSADLENAQATILEESNKYNSALEAMDELENTIGDIEVAMESDVDLVTAQLLVNSLNKHSNVLYGKDLQSAGLQSDSPKNVLEAGLLDGKGMVNAVKEFIAKVWQKIKNAFSYVWNKMKEFWAWLTGSKKKAKEKLEETIVAAATVEAAETKKEDIKKAEEDVKANKNPDDSLKRFRKRQNYAKASRAGKLDTNEDGTIADIKDGKFKGRRIADLSVGEFNEWMAESKSNQDIIIDVVVEDIIVEEIAKTTNIDESIVYENILSAKKIIALIESDRDKGMAIVNIIGKNIDDNRDSINKALVLPSIYGASATLDNIVISLRSAFEDYSQFKKETNFESELLKAVENTLSKNIKQTIPFMLADSSTIAGVSTYLKVLDHSLEDVSKIISFYDTMLNEKWEDSSSKDATLDLKSFVSSFPVSITDTAGDKNSLFLNYVNPFEQGFLVLTGVAQTVKDYNVDVGIFKEFSVLAKRTNLDNIVNSSLDVKKIQSDIEKITSEMDKILDKLAKNEVQKYRDDKQWKQGKNSFVHFVSRFAAYNPKIIIDAARANTDRINYILNTMDIPGAIAQATKEGK